MVRVSETGPGLSIPSRNTDRGVKADSETSYIFRRCLIDFVQRGLPASHAVYVKCVLSTQVSLWSKETCYSAKKNKCRDTNAST